ncbi:hypothetical protein BCV70DRAFT_103626 [Testicularia cyperi]|uniref:Potassium transport protein n=1 Tax=Testicularia cyperi TaxID=1882483 RepID=A0A317XRL0_9BASI|nr:hypothetical protein BCV70DRAFT_103626 [Testicularia cyperi]
MPLNGKGAEALKPLNTRMKAITRWCGRNLNFFRVHVLVFTFTPLIAACIFYACNGETHVPFVDSLFVCVSAMTVTGLVTFNISTTNGGQQAILFILMCIGNISAVSITMIWIRRNFFRRKFDHVVRRSARVRRRLHDVEEQERRERRHNIAKIQRMMGLKSADSATTISDQGADEVDRTDSDSSGHIELKRIDTKKKGKRKPLRADMIRRIDGPAFLINSAGDRSHFIPDGQTILPNTENAAPLTEEPQSIEVVGQGETPASGGILASPNQTDVDNESSQQQQPSIRISVPHPSATSNDVDRVSPSDSTPRRGSGARRLSIPRFTSRHDPDADTDEENEHAVDDEELETGGVHAPSLPSSPPLRAHFPDTPQHQSPGLPSGRGRRVSDPPQSHFRRGSDTGLLQTYNAHEKHDMFPRAQTVEFAIPSDFRSTYDLPSETPYTTAVNPSLSGPMRQRGTTINRTVTGRTAASGRYSSTRGVPLARTQTSSKQRGFGGFPTPIEIAGFAIKKAMPGVQERFQRTMTMPRTATITSIRSGGGVTDNTAGGKSAPYLSFDASVSGNSRFHSLTEAQREELGGVEYRALDLLAKLVPLYWLTLNLGVVTIVAPYINSRAFDKYKPVFEAQGANKPNYTWFWFFQVVSAYSNTGQTLIDTSMTQMQDAYFLLIPMGFLILAGNTGFPIVLRFFIWTISKLVPSGSRIYETLRFLLDHPRRCFVYLFPSGQTWFLFFVLVAFNATDWVAFLVLDIGNPVIESIKTDIRVFDGLFQSVAVRAAGFTVVSLLALAPAVQFLYVVMMYLSAFPLALSVRSTNVYEEKSLGVYVDEPTEPGALPQETNAKVWGNFLASHARRQLAFDIWWLGFALWLVCITERNNIQDPNSNGWFTIFSCLFELTSAYGTVGLSLGTPYDNFSLSGRFSTLSKLVVCAVMIRGRHRGLPVAIDRAILLPSELEQEDADDDFSQLGDTWDRDSTFIMDPRFEGMGVPARARSNSDTENAASAVKRTQSGVSFAVGSTGRRGSMGPTDFHSAATLSPKHQTEFVAGGIPEPRRSFSMPPSAMPLNAPHHHGMMGGAGLGAMGHLSSIDEMPNGATPNTESRAESPVLATPSTDPPSFTSSGSAGSSKGKERDAETTSGHAHTQKELEAARQYGCSTPEGRDSPRASTSK